MKANTILSASSITELKAGMKISVAQHEYLKVMAIVDGYVMMRYKGCIPFVEKQERFNEMFPLRGW